MLATGRSADAERELRAAVDLIAGVAAAHPGVSEYKEALAGNHFDLGRLLRVTAARPRADAEREMRKGLEGFAQLYSDIAEQIMARMEGREPPPLSLQVPTVEQGIRGVRFIEAAVRSSKEGAAWTPI